MIQSVMTIHLSISLPYSWSADKPVKWFDRYYDRKITKWKSFEWETIYVGWRSLFEVALDLIPVGSDHASVGFNLTVLGFSISAKIYDSRHWDTVNNCWCVYDKAYFDRLDRNSASVIAENLQDAYSDVADDLDQKAQIERDAYIADYLETPQGLADIQAEIIRSEGKPDDPC